MIQDIQPHILFNQYRNKVAQPNDYVLHFKDRKVLCKKAETLALPQICDLQEQNKQLRKQVIFLFSIDEQHYFLAQSLSYDVEAEYGFVDVRAFMDEEKQEARFAVATGLQLYTWYDCHRFCGRCQHPMEHAKDERMLYCDHCGNLEYPKIAPAVIVGIKHGDKLLLTKYRGRSHKKYALVAGFAEIGETIEETVQREVMEEVGLKVKNIKYYKSQPWGLSDTLLMGFYADVDGSDTIVLDERELALGEWIERGNIDEDISRLSLTGEMIEQFRNGKI